LVEPLAITSSPVKATVISVLASFKLAIAPTKEVMSEPLRYNFKLVAAKVLLVPTLSVKETANLNCFMATSSLESAETEKL